MNEIPTLTDVVEPKPAVDLSCLSGREKQVLKLIATGYRITDIAAQMFRSPKTITTHKERIKRKLGIKSSVEWMNLLRALPVVPTR